MRTIQQDTVDTYGRRTVPLMIQLAESVKADYSEEDQKDLNVLFKQMFAKSR